MSTASLYLYENFTYMRISHMSGWIFGGGWESYHYSYVSLFGLDADILLSGAFTNDF